jgi:hypothetical protein
MQQRQRKKDFLFMLLFFSMPFLFLSNSHEYCLFFQDLKPHSLAGAAPNLIPSCLLWGYNDITINL